MILERIAAATRDRVAAAKSRSPLAQVRAAAEALPQQAARPFAAALAQPGVSFICEVKRASPSKGIIAPHFPYLDIARDYTAAGADAISVLTEPDFFLGSDDYLREIAAAVPTPVLRKDFTIDPYQIYEAKLLGASAVLLIRSLLDEASLREALALCDALGLSALVEVHDAAELDSALSVGAAIIGVNNRNLGDFSVDLSNSARLRDQVPAGTLFVAESGIRNVADVAALRAIGVDAVLVGEALMRSPDRGAALTALRGIEA